MNADLNNPLKGHWQFGTGKSKMLLCHQDMLY
jgi:hypothetical protein